MGDRLDGAVDRSPDTALVAALRGGDEAAFRELVGTLTPVLLRLARSCTSSATGAQDAVQDTWLVVLDRLPAFEGRSSLSTWICGICVHTARRSAQRDARTVPFSSAWRADRAPAVEPGRFHRTGAAAGTWAHPPLRWDRVPEEVLTTSELQAVVTAAIAALPRGQREVITARDVLGLPADEAAEALGLTPGNARVLLHRARSTVRSAVEAYAATATSLEDHS